MSIKFELMKLE